MDRRALSQNLNPNTAHIYGNLLMLLAAAIWGFAFVAQRVGMDYVGPFTYTGVRFLLGGLSLLPLIYYFSRTGGYDRPSSWKETMLPGLLAGTVLFTAVSLQQVGMLYTSAGKAAFITGLYLVLVPILGIFLKQRTNLSTWLGCVLGLIGLYFLCIRESSTIQFGDLLVLIGAFFWAVHIHVIGRFNWLSAVRLSCIQFLTCSLLGLSTAVIFESITINSLSQAALPILYGGLCSVGIAYTLQVVGQKFASPAHAAIILSMEAVFGVLGGYLLLQERMGLQEMTGCFLMLSGMLVSQLRRSANP
ncbi:MAG: DMT family transporter [Deltaproteobacteria bacterium]